MKSYKTVKKCQVDTDNIFKNASKVRHDYAVSNLVYVDKTGFYQKLDKNKH